MNERIKELSEQAGMVIVDDEFSTYGKFAEKFAELIVRECAGICEKDGKWWAEKGYLMEAGEAGSLATQIKKHFGVSE